MIPLRALLRRNNPATMTVLIIGLNVFLFIWTLLQPPAQQTPDCRANDPIRQHVLLQPPLITARSGPAHEDLARGNQGTNALVVR